MSLPSLPEHVGPYLIEGELGRGNFGVVYLARRGPGVEPCALKVFLRPEAAEDGARFVREVEVMSQLDHPGIVSALESGYHGRHPWLAAEYVEGETLEVRLRRGPLSAAEARRLILDLADALEYAHERGVVHRDLKPANILLDRRDGRPRVMDFGLARVGAAVDSLTRTGDALGTPYYMAPEQLVDAKRADHRADLYALGVILYQCLAGVLPFRGATVHEVLTQVQRGKPPSLRRLAPDAPPALLDACERAMARLPEDRFQTARALTLALGDPQPVKAASSVRLLVPALALALLGALGLVWAFADSPPVEAPPPVAEPEPAPRAPTAEELQAVRVGQLRERLAAVEPASASLDALRALELPDDAELPPVRDGLARGLLERAAGLASRHAPYRELLELTAQAERIAASEALKAQAQLDCATYAFRRGRFEEASERATQVRHEGRIGLQARYVAAYGQLWQDRYQPALEALEGIWRDDPQGVVGLNAGAVFNSHTGHNDVGARLARAALALDPDYVDAYISLAFCLNDLSHREPERKAELLAESLRSSAEANRRSPDHPRPLLARAYALSNSGRGHEALLAYDELIRLTQPRPMARALRQRARYRVSLNDDRVGALADLEAALERDPDDAEALLWRGVLREYEGHRERAEEDWVRAARADQQAMGRALQGVPQELRNRIVAVVRQRLGAR